MRIQVNSPFISDKIAVNWQIAGMKKGTDKPWLDALRESLRKNKDYDWLKQALEDGKKLKLKLSIRGRAQSLKLLDIHDALARTIDKTVDCLFPRKGGKPVPQTKDRHFWKVEARKFISPEERVEIEIEELEKE